MITRVVLHLLGRIGNEPVSVAEALGESSFDRETFNECLKSLSREGILRIEDGFVCPSSRQRITLALKAISLGADLRSACEPLEWREFEDLVAFAIESAGYLPIKHFRFRDQARKYEIDLLCMKYPNVLSLDCKHWKRSWLISTTWKIAQDQLERSRALASEVWNLRERMRIGDWPKLRIVPGIVTLSETPYRICDGVPVVPVQAVQDFLNGPYLDGSDVRKVIVDPLNKSIDRKTQRG